MRNLHKLGKGSRLLLAVVVGGAVFGIATAVQASIPDANGVIHGCYAKAGNPSQGALRVSDTGICKPIENPLTWNQKGPTGPTGQRGPTGPTGSGGGARAYAYVLPGASPSLDPARTKNFSGVINNGTGIYCLTPSGGVTEAGSTPLVTVEWGESSGSNLSAFWREHPLGNSCPNTTDFEVRTYTFTAGGDNALSDNVAFDIVVP
jgi:hypothetical protein